MLGFELKEKRVGLLDGRLRCDMYLKMETQDRGFWDLNCKGFLVKR